MQAPGGRPLLPIALSGALLRLAALRARIAVVSPPWLWPALASRANVRIAAACTRKQHFSIRYDQCKLHGDGCKKISVVVYFERPPFLLAFPLHDKIRLRAKSRGLRALQPCIYFLGDGVSIEIEVLDNGSAGPIKNRKMERADFI